MPGSGLPACAYPTKRQKNPLGSTGAGGAPSSSGGAQTVACGKWFHLLLSSGILIRGYGDFGGDPVSWRKQPAV